MHHPASITTNVTHYRVIYGDTDKMGVVYYANYLRWFEIGRSEFLRQLEIPYAGIEQRNIHFPAIEASCRYLRPARYDDLLTIETHLRLLTRATLTFSYRVTRNDEQNLMAAGSTKHACVNDRGQILRIPSDLWKVLGSAVTATESPKSSRTRQ